MSLWSVLQSNSAQPDPGTGAVAYTTANLTAGTKLIALICCGGGSSPEVTAMTDGSTINMTKLASVFLNGVQGSGETSIWAQDTPGGVVGTKPTITPTKAGGNQSLGIVIQEVGGLLSGNTSAMIDGTVASNTGNISANGPITCGAYTSGVAGEYLVALGSDNEVGTLTYGVPTGSTTYTRDAHAVNGSFVFNCVPAYGDSTGGAESASFAITGVTGTNAWATLMIAFKLAPTTPNSGPNSPTVGTDLGGGSGSWTNPGNIKADDGSVALWTVV